MKLRLESQCAWDGINEVIVDRYPFVIGRDTDSDCPLPFAFLSRQHCLLAMQDQEVVVHDLKSHNGTYLNGVRLRQPTAVRHGDELTLGTLCFRVSALATTVDTTSDTAFASTGHLPTIDTAAFPAGGGPGSKE